MPKSKKRRKKRKDYSSIREKFLEGLTDETKQGVLSVIFFVLAVFFVLAHFGYAGIAGDFTYSFLVRTLGAGFFLLPVAFLLVSISFFRQNEHKVVTQGTLGGLLFILACLGTLEMLLPTRGGWLGKISAYPFEKFFGTVAGLVFLIAFIVISLLLIFNTRLPSFSLRRKKGDVADTPTEEKSVHILDSDDANDVDKRVYADENSNEKYDVPEKEAEPDADSVNNTAGAMGLHISLRAHDYKLPPISLLEGDTGKPNAGDIKAHSNTIKRTLRNFNIEVEIDEVSIGPSITRYAIKPAEGVRLSRIVALGNDLSLALAAHPVRIEAPIPGKSLVGIEVPNPKKSLVGLGTLLLSREIQESLIPLAIALGKTVTGIPMFANLGKAPHILIAGSTGSGKSVTIHAIINSLLFRNTPDTLRFLLIDPKRVELTTYNGIPHLLTPVITDAKKAILALKWAITEMERRYSILETESVRDINTYHNSVLGPALAKNKSRDNSDDLPEPMPHIVIVIDELADIMATYPKELEAAVVRLSQMSRAIGIHLVLSTQRPSVNVITGLIKANIPARIALQVSSQIDSRTILDMTGAEKLLGAGDMLYMSGDMSRPVRLQSAYVTEQEVKKVAKFLQKEAHGDEGDNLNLEEVGSASASTSFNLEDDSSEFSDELYEDARELVILTKKASTSYLQRKFGLGYARAARLMDMLEERGVVGPAQGSRPREVYEKMPEEPPDENIQQEGS